jgi:CubicO group peptidase (beta-lactamase class C family)
MASGHFDAEFAPVRDVFDEVITGPAGTGAAVCFRYQGRKVVDLWGGWMDAAGSRPWAEHSIVQPYSVSKPLAATCGLVGQQPA